MRIPISGRLLCCASLVEPGARVVDVGCDHGYLGVYLLQEGIAAHVTAADLRPKPLARARENAARFGTAGRMTFLACDGLSGVREGTADTVICAGMGGETIANILARCPWVFRENCRLILQPQASGSELRGWLGSNGFAIREERLVRDGRFLYNVLLVRHGGGVPVSPGGHYASRALLTSGSPLLPEYLSRVERALREAEAGLERARDGEEAGRLAYYRAALREVTEMRRTYGDNRENP